MRKIWAVALREYRASVRSKSFIIAIVMVPIFMFGGIAVQIFMAKKGDAGTRRVAVIDHSGAMFSVLEAAAKERTETHIHDPETGKQIEPIYELIDVPADAADPQGQLLELSDQVRAEKYFAFIEIAADVMAGADSPDDDAFGIRYYSNQQANRALPRWLSWKINEQVKEARFAEAGLDAAVVAKALAEVPREDLNLLSKTETGEIKAAEKADRIGTIMVPFAMMMFMFMGLMVTTQPMMHGVLEEKMQRIAEVLLGSISPFGLMMGKLLGHMMIALTLLAIYFAGGYAVASYFGKADLIEPRLIAWFMAFLGLGVFMFGSLYLAIGACCNDVKEAQSLIMPVMFPMMIPLFMLGPVIEDPNGTLATVSSLVPIWAPMMMMMRLAMPVVVPAWQPIAAMAGCLVGTVVCVWAAGRVFRLGLLMQGKPPKLGELLRWVARG